MPLNFVAIDFETANFARSSACSVGVARVTGGQIVEQTEWLIDPPGGRLFTNTAIHGIEEHHVLDAPSWAETLERLDRFVGSADLVAYSGFDRGVYNAANKLHVIERPDYMWRNALSLVKSRYPLEAHPLPDHRLPSIANHLGLGKFDHHSAAADAAMCAMVVLKIALEHELDDASIWPAPSSGGGGSRRPYVYRPKQALPERNASTDPTHPLFGEVVCFSGDLNGFTRADAQRIVADFGATVAANVTKKTTLVVMGQYDPATLRAGAKLSTKIEKALGLASNGQRIEVIEESTFIELINLDPAEYA